MQKMSMDSASAFLAAPFTNYTIPLLLLTIIVGGSSLLAAATVFIRREWAVLLSALAGLIMIAWEVIELAMIPQFSWMQPLFIALGLVVFGLASYLWMTEYREHHFPTRHAIHA